jgi:hypothetical protein
MNMVSDHMGLRRDFVAGSGRIRGMAWEHHRRDQRMASPVVRLSIEGKVFRTVNWSFGGFLVQPYTGRWRAGDEVLVEAIAPGEGKGFKFNTMATIVRVDRKEELLAARFETLNTRAFGIIEKLMRARTKS